MFWAKERSEVEVINDTNTEVVNFYQTVQKNYAELHNEIQATLHSREQHRQAVVVYENPAMFFPVKRAWAFWVLASQSFGASLGSGWRYGRSKKVETLIDAKKKRFTEELTKRIEMTQIECADAIKVIKTRDSVDTFFYCDPPYFNANMGHYKGYTEDDFKRLLDTLSTIQGKFMLSSYPSKILKEYSEKYGWRTIHLPKKVRVLRGETRSKAEVVTLNYS